MANAVTVIKAYFNSPTPGGSTPRELDTSELKECAQGDKEFYSELKSFCKKEMNPQ